MKEIERGDEIRMELKNIDKSFMMIFLLEECNFSCDHCVREDEPMSPGYKLTFEQLKTCLEDCKNLKTIKRVHFSGGEPTLWRDDKRDLVDLLIEISKAGFEPGFTTNGSNFVDFTKSRYFFKKYLESTKKRLHLFISIDSFHQNFDIDKGRAKSLDNVLRCKRDLSSQNEKLLKVTVLVTVSRDDKSLPPGKMIEHYESLGVEFDFIPLGLKGKAKSLSYLCPGLKSDNPEDLGAYYPFHKKKKGEQVKSSLILIGNDYYLYDYDYSVEFKQRWNKVGRLGHLTEKSMRFE